MTGGLCFKGINLQRNRQWERVHIKKTLQARDHMDRWSVTQEGSQKLKPTLEKLKNNTGYNREPLNS